MSPLISKEDEVNSRATFGLEFGFSVTAFGYVFDFAFDLFDWQLNSWEEWPLGMALWVGPLYFAASDGTIHNLDQPEQPDTKNVVLSNAELLNLQETERQLQVKYRQALETIEELRTKLNRSHKKKPLISPYRLQEIKQIGRAHV